MYQLRGVVHGAPCNEELANVEWVWQRRERVRGLQIRVGRALVDALAEERDGDFQALKVTVRLQRLQHVANEAIELTVVCMCGRVGV